MLFETSLRRLATAIVCAAFFTACGGSDDVAAPATTTAAPVETTTTTTAPETTTEAPETTVDNRTDRERAIDRLDLTLLQLRTADLVATADCVVERLESEGIEVTGEGAPELIAALGCEPALGYQLMGAASFDVDDEQGECIVNALITGAAQVPLTEAEAFFSTPTPPDTLLQGISTICDVTIDQLEQGFG